MNALTKHHDRAMDFAELAEAARLRKETVRQSELLQKALAEELKAVALCNEDVIPEPTFSILHRSAAALAIDCRHYQQAGELAAKALAGEPPPEIAEELRELLTRAKSLSALGAVKFNRPVMRKKAPKRLLLTTGGNSITAVSALKNTATRPPTSKRITKVAA